MRVSRVSRVSRHFSDPHACERGKGADPFHMRLSYSAVRPVRPSRDPITIYMKLIDKETLLGSHVRVSRGPFRRVRPVRRETQPKQQGHA